MKRKLLITLALISILFLFGFTFQASQPRQWEYKVEQGINDKKFNELGSQGWDLASCGNYAGPGLPYCVFKRAK